MGKNLKYSLVQGDEESNITVYTDGGEQPLLADESHPNWDAIVKGAIEDDESILDLFDSALAIGSKFEMLSERVSVANGKVYLDGDEMDNSLTKHILRCFKDGVKDYAPLALFFEKIQQNPSANSREQLYNWLGHSEFTITGEGDFIAYKGVVDNGGKLVSDHSGEAIINGVYHADGQVPNEVGSVIEYARNKVVDNPSRDCAEGLHVATYQFAKGFTKGPTLACIVNPRDVVSVPSHDVQKIRVCRYRVHARSDDGAQKYPLLGGITAKLG